MTAGELRQGKCSACRKGWRWPGDLAPLSGSACPECGSRLERTTHLAKLDWRPTLAAAPPAWHSKLAGQLRRASESGPA